LPNALATVVGQPRATRLLTASLAAPHHAYLFAGPPHVGKTTAAIAFAQALNCPDHGCLDCLECRTIAHSNHPDVRVISLRDKRKADEEKAAAKPDGAKKKAERTVIGVDEVRAFLEEVGWKAFRARHKVYVLPYDEINLQGANTLLKTLEEPNPGTVLVLTAPSVESVLPTVVSRCQLIPFNPVPPPAIEAWLVATQGIEPAKAKHLARVADGRLGWAAERVKEGELPEPTLLAADSYSSALAEAEKLAGLDNETQQEALEVLIAQARDIMIRRQTGRADWLARPDLPEAPARRGLPLSYWLRVVTQLEGARHQLRANGNKQLVWAVLAGAIQPTALERARSAS
jgi:DNA polymerase-3 subunit delta'